MKLNRFGGGVVETLESRRLLAAGPSLVADLNTAPADSAPRYRMAELNGVHYFFATDAAGLELWRTDGTDVGTFRVKDVNPGPEGLAGPGGGMWPELTVVGGTLFFTAYESAHGRELWKSDGTAGGTVMVREIDFRDFPQSAPSFLTNVNGELVFTASETGGSELWTSDGTEAGTRPVESPPVNLVFHSLSPRTLTIDDTTFFVGSSSERGYELWKTTGGIEDAVFVKDTLPGPLAPFEQPPTGFAAVGDTLYFVGEDAEHGRELWKSDGTADGTVMVKDIVPGPDPSLPEQLGESGGRLFFQTGGALYVSDGTDAGTVRVTSPSINFTSVKYVRAVGPDGNGGVFFTAMVPSTGGLSREMLLWNDGTPDGTRVVKDVVPPGAVDGIGNLHDAGGRLYFTVRSMNSLTAWTSDGTADGTIPLPVPGMVAPATNSAPPPWLGSDGTSVFLVGSDEAGQELWATDGTAAGTRRVEDLFPGTGGTSVTGVAAVGGSVVFAAGGLLYRSGGGEAPAVIPGAPSGVTELVAGDGAAFFFASSPAPALWKTDGTAAGTVKLSDLANPASGGSPTPSKLVATASRRTVYFHVRRYPSPGLTGELWKSDGTATGTVMVKRLAAQGRVFAMATLGENLYFSHDDGVHSGLWKSDGTAEGTALAFDAYPTGGDDNAWLTPYGERLLFKARVSRALVQFFVTDGTPGGTVALAPAPGAGSPWSNVAVLNGAAYFGVWDDGAGALWRTDGTAAGTAPVKLVAPSAQFPTPMRLSTVGGTLLFTTGDADAGYTLWRSDGTAAGTEVVTTFAPAPDRLGPEFFGEANGVRLFAAYDPSAGRELWQTDGTAAGTRRVADLFPGDFGSYPAVAGEGGVVDDTLYFTAIDPEHGRELWRYTPDAPAATVVGAWATGSTWSAGFLQRLQSQGLGSAALGAALTAARPLPWVNVDRISLRFSRGVDVRQGDLRITGADGSAYATAGFAYDPQAATATWTLARPIDRPDRVRVELDGRVGGPAGWSARVDVLPGDVDGSGAVLAGDFSDVKRRFFSTATGAGDYDVFCDVNGSGSILADDFSEVRRRFFQALPGDGDAPATAGGPSSRADGAGEGVTPITAQVLA